MQESTTPTIRRAAPYLRCLRYVRGVLHLLWACLAAAVLYPRWTQAGRLTFKQRWSRQLFSALGIRLQLEGAAAPPGALIVANHISWLDIFAINTLRPAAFIAKAEVRRWPLVGWLAWRNDTVFLHRGSRQDARRINGDIDARLAEGGDVAVFPEGHTTDGDGLLDFHAALLQPAVETGRPVLPMAIAYFDARGRRSRAPSFAGKITLRQCVAAIVACRGLTARVTVLPPIATEGKQRRAVAQEAQAAIATRLGFLPANKSPETPPDPPA